MTAADPRCALPAAEWVPVLCVMVQAHIETMVKVEYAPPAAAPGDVGCAAAPDGTEILREKNL